MSIIINTIHSMQWATEDHTSVFLVADTNTGDGEYISTPYSEESIVWESVRAFPVANIAEYTPPQPIEQVE